MIGNDLQPFAMQLLLMIAAYSGWSDICFIPGFSMKDGKYQCSVYQGCTSCTDEGEWILYVGVWKPLAILWMCTTGVGTVFAQGQRC